MGKMLEAELISKYPQVVPGSLRYDAVLNKQFCMAKLNCGCTKEVATSDLFQVKTCKECRNKAKEARMAELKAEWKAQHEEAVARRAAKKGAKAQARAERKAKQESEKAKAA